MKPFTKVAAVLFGIVALIHLFRLILPFPVILGNIEVPRVASIALFLITIVFCIGLWKESKR